MPANRDDPKEIQSLDIMTGIRSRPQMYLPALDHPEVINHLLQECLCIPLDNALNGCASDIRISLRQDRSIALWDNGPPLPLHGKNGQPVVQELLTNLGACRDAKRSLHKDLCRVGIVVANSLSEWFVVESAVDSVIWQQKYERGLPTGPFVRTGTTDSLWERFSFLPDVEIFGEMTVDVPAFRRWFVEQQFQLDGCTVTLTDEVRGMEFSLSSPTV